MDFWKEWAPFLPGNIWRRASLSFEGAFKKACIVYIPIKNTRCNVRRLEFLLSHDGVLLRKLVCFVSPGWEGARTSETQKDSFEEFLWGSDPIIGQGRGRRTVHEQHQEPKRAFTHIPNAFHRNYHKQGHINSLVSRITFHAKFLPVGNWKRIHTGSNTTKK